MRLVKYLRQTVLSGARSTATKMTLCAFFVAVGYSPALSQTLRQMPPITPNPINGKPVDILGVVPGMSFAEAKPLIDQHDMRFSRMGAWRFPDPVTKQQYIWFYGGGVTGDVRRRPQDNLVVQLSSESTGNQVIGVSRTVIFPETEQPVFKELLNALADKYGKYSRVFGLDDSYKVRAGPQAEGQEVPIISDYCAEYRWYLNKKGEEQLRGLIFGMGDVLASLFNSITGLEEASRILTSGNSYLPKIVALDAGFNVSARICAAHLPERASRLELRVLDLSRAMAAAYLEQQKLDERNRAIQQQKESVPAASVPKL